MNSTFKTSLLATIFAFGMTGSAMAATEHAKQVGVTHHRHHSQRSAGQSLSNQEQQTEDLNTRSLQAVDAINKDPNTGILSPTSSANRQVAPVIVAPVTVGAGVVPPPPVGNAAAVSATNPVVNSVVPGTVNPNHMPPAN